MRASVGYTRCIPLVGALGLGAFGLGTAGADPPPGRQVVTLPEALEEAERTFPGLSAARHRVAASEAQLDEAWVAPFGNVTVTGFASISPSARGNPTFSPDAFGQSPFQQGYGSLARLTVDTGVPISPWTWVRLARVRDAARQGLRVSEEELRRARLDLRANVRRAWYGLAFARDSLYLLDRAEGYLREAQEQVDRALDGGAGATQVDTFRLRTYRAELVSRRAQAVLGERRARLALGALTGLGGRVDAPDLPLCPVPYDDRPLAAHLSDARLGRPEVHMLSAGVEARRAALSIQRGALWPDLALGLTVAWAGSSAIADQANPFAANNSNYAYWGAGLVLRWSFEPLAWRQRVRRLSEELAMTEDQQRLALGGIAVEVEEAFEGVQEARARLDATVDGEDAASSWFTTVFQEYQAGTGDTGAVVDPLRQYLTARYNHLQAVYDYNAARARLAQVTGRDQTAGEPSACAAGGGSTAPEVTPEDPEVERLLRESAAPTTPTAPAAPAQDAGRPAR
ncbi:MAG: TolC family protein [Deltaproteobacteria bacterium]|nr:TolC family protein [Deltaproteobacteria bacterium]